MMMMNVRMERQAPLVILHVANVATSPGAATQLFCLAPFLYVHHNVNTSSYVGTVRVVDKWKLQLVKCLSACVEYDRERLHKLACPSF